jgi:hypothetical protein
MSLETSLLETGCGCRRRRSARSLTNMFALSGESDEGLSAVRQRRHLATWERVSNAVAKHPKKAVSAFVVFVGLLAAVAVVAARAREGTGSPDPYAADNKATDALATKLKSLVKVSQGRVGHGVVGAIPEGRRLAHAECTTRAEQRPHAR